MYQLGVAMLIVSGCYKLNLDRVHKKLFKIIREKGGTDTFLE